MAPMADTQVHTGACLCGAVKYTVNGKLRPVIYCHCEQCRRTSGHFVAATAAEREELLIEASEHLRWYQSSKLARRGFCDLCGASLFWDSKDQDHVSIMAGTLDDSGSLVAEEHIYVDFKGGYYEIGDSLPQKTSHEWQ